MNEREKNQLPEEEFQLLWYNIISRYLKETLSEIMQSWLNMRGSSFLYDNRCKSGFMYGYHPRAMLSVFCMRAFLTIQENGF